MRNPNSPHEDFGPEIALLRESSPPLTPLELDTVKRRIGARADRSSDNRWLRFARSRGAVVAAIATGAMMTTGGTALGVSGLASSGSATTAQYAGSTGTGAGSTGAGVGSQAGSGAAAPSIPGSTGSAPSLAAPSGASTTEAEKAAPANRATSAAELVEQVPTVSSGQLPFTGFAAIPILIIGLALLMLGLLGRRWSARGDDGSPG